MEDSRMPKHPFLKSIPPSRKMAPSVPSTSSVVRNRSQGTAPRSSNATTIWMLPQSNSYLQLSQILQQEIASHDQTREELRKEIQRRIDMQNISWNQSQEITHWKTSCEDAYAAMNQHRLESEGLHHENDLLKYENNLLRSQLESHAAQEVCKFSHLVNRLHIDDSQKKKAAQAADRCCNSKDDDVMKDIEERLKVPSDSEGEMFQVLQDDVYSI
jgi:hypothetical protein